MMQVAPQMPPQSTSDSFWFLTVSLQLGAWQVQGGTGQMLLTPHTALTQSDPDTQERVAAHRGQAFGPPQSTSVSEPFF
jgi:hypothetical protein